MIRSVTQITIALFLCAFSGNASQVHLERNFVPVAQTASTVAIPLCGIIPPALRLWVERELS